jgi:hypothetical protein
MIVCANKCCLLTLFGMQTITSLEMDGASEAHARAMLLLLSVIFELAQMIQQIQLQTADNTKKLLRELQLRSHADGEILCYVREGGNVVAKSFELEKLASTFFHSVIKPLTFRMSWCFLFDEDMYEIMDKQ